MSKTCFNLKACQICLLMLLNCKKCFIFPIIWWFFFFLGRVSLKHLDLCKVVYLGRIARWYHVTIVLLMYYLSQKGCSFVIVSKSTCLKIHALAPSRHWSVCRLLSQQSEPLSSVWKSRASLLAPVLQLLRRLCGSEQDVMEQTWLLRSWLSWMARLSGPLISRATVGWALIRLSHTSSGHSFSLWYHILCLHSWKPQYTVQPYYWFSCAFLICGVVQLLLNKLI